MVVVSTPPTQNYEEFTKKVGEYSSKEPFNFVVPELLRKYEKVFLDASSTVNARVPPCNLCYTLNLLVSVRVHLRGVSLRFSQALRESLRSADT